MSTSLGELRIAARSLWKARGFSVAAIATLGIAIGLEASTLAVINAYLIRSLPYPAADRLYTVTYGRPGENPPRGLNDLNWSVAGDVVEHAISWDLDVFYLLGGGQAEAVPGAWVTYGFMQGLAIRPVVGRSFTPDEFASGGPQVALISHALWQGRFGGDAAVLGRSFAAYVSDRPQDADVFTIVGVLPPDFWHVNTYTGVLTPLRARSYPYMLRLRSGITPAVAEHRLTELVRPLVPAGAELRVRLQSVHQRYVAEIRPLLRAIAAAVTLVLLIACANVAFLVLIRSMRRQKEIALRLTLGAGRLRIARLLVSEAFLLCAAAVALGTGLAALAVQRLAPMIEQHLGRQVPGGVSAVSVDATVLILIGAAALVISIALALAPLFFTTRHSLFPVLRRGRQGGVDGVQAGRTRTVLVAAEVAGSLSLLVGCGLLVRTVLSLLAVDLGIQPTNVVSATLALRESSYPDAATRVHFYDQLLRALQRVPAVRSAALSTPSPLVEFQPRPLLADQGATAHGTSASVRAITADYFTALGMSIRVGRAFTDLDRIESQPVAVVSESLARGLWPDGDAVGRSVRVIDPGRASSDTTVMARVIVGVVSDVRQSPTDAETADVYVPLLQLPERFSSIVVRTASSATLPIDALTRALGEIDSEVSLGAVRGLTTIVEEQLARPRFLAWVFTAFGLFAATLALLGVYAVIAYSVRQREHEIAVRMAVGAEPHAIVRLFLRNGIPVLAAGLAAGVLGGLGIGRLLGAQLHGVAFADLPTLATAALALGAACVVATWWPARRAATTDPAVALREEG